MGKADLLRAMREAQAVAAERVPETPRPKPIAASKKSPTRRVKTKAKNGSAKRFVPNKTKGRPNADKAHLTNEARKPWETMGVSRRTWYRHQATGGT